MAKKTYYFPNPKRLLSGFLKDLSKKEIEHTNQQIKDLLNKKKAKLRALYNSRSHQVIQPNLLPTKLVYPQFMAVSPISKEQPFISEKIKANVLTPQRFYSRQPNMRGGSFSEPKRWSLPDDRQIVNAKFQDYSRIVDDQSGIIKHERMARIMQSKNSLLEHPKQKYSRMKKTYFQKFLADKYNFYNPPEKKSLGAGLDSTLRKSRTNANTIAETVVDIRRQISSMGSKQFKHTEILDMLSSRSQERNKVILRRQRLKTVVIAQKNLDSLP